MQYRVSHHFLDVTVGLMRVRSEDTSYQEDDDEADENQTASNFLLFTHEFVTSFF
jgi:hypothetical protein